MVCPKEDFLAKVCEIFDVSEIEHAADQSEEQLRPKQKGEYSMFLGEKWYLCRLKEAGQES